MVRPTSRRFVGIYSDNLHFRVENILTGVSEADKVLVRDNSSTHGFVILPDMKWDLINLSNLYLVAIALDRNIHSLRDLKKNHIPMLQAIRSEACRSIKERWGLDDDQLRFYVHYQPSYCKNTPQGRPHKTPEQYSLDHFHVHIVNANYVGLMGMSVGQAHLLEDIVALASQHIIRSGPFLTVVLRCFSLS